METRRIVRDFTGWFVRYFVALPSISRGSIVPFAWQDATALGIYVEPFTRQIPRRRRLDFMDSPWKEFRRESANENAARYADLVRLPNSDTRDRRRRSPIERSSVGHRRWSSFYARLVAPRRFPAIVLPLLNQLESRYYENNWNILTADQRSMRIRGPRFDAYTCTLIVGRMQHASQY